VDLIAESVGSWTHIPDACPNFTIDEYHDVDHAPHEHEGVLAALRERGIADDSIAYPDVKGCANAIGSCKSGSAVTGHRPKPLDWMARQQMRSSR
jgi:Cu2+-containing amine oxidase